MVGIKKLFVSIDNLNKFYEKSHLKLEELTKDLYYPNQFLLMKDTLGSSASAIGIVDENCRLLRN